jgi:hypothetical protein
MTSAARTSISALPRGHEFARARVELRAERVRAYLAAVGDDSPYGNAVPPLAAVALGLAALQEQLSLPDGALHTGQEVEHLAPVRAGESLILTGRVAQRSERQGMVISVIEFELAADDTPAVRARTTIMSPVAET